MWCCKPRRFGSGTVALLVCLILLGGCGFRPIYGTATQGNTAAALASVDVEPISDRVGQILHNHLLDLLNPRGRPERPRYRLSVNLSESVERIAFRKTEVATRANLWLRVSFTLQGAAGESVLSGNLSVVSSYNILQTDFATLAAEQDARERAARQLAEELRLQLAARLSSPDAS